MAKGNLMEVIIYNSKQIKKEFMRIKKEVRTWSGVQVPAAMKGHSICTATHPNQPNYSGHSRGRKIHLVKSNEMTFCNMLVDQLAPKSYNDYTMTKNGICKNCLIAIKNQ